MVVRIDVGTACVVVLHLITAVFGRENSSNGDL
jgi:hypothetical protein